LFAGQPWTSRYLVVVRFETTTVWSVGARALGTTAIPATKAAPIPSLPPLSVRMTRAIFNAPTKHHVLHGNASAGRTQRAFRLAFCRRQSEIRIVGSSWPASRNRCGGAGGGRTCNLPASCQPPQLLAMTPCGRKYAAAWRKAIGISSCMNHPRRRRPAQDASGDALTRNNDDVMAWVAIRCPARWRAPQPPAMDCFGSRSSPGPPEGR